MSDIGVFDLIRRAKEICPFECDVSIFKVRDTDMIRIKWHFDFKDKRIGWEAMVSESCGLGCTDGWDTWLEHTKEHMRRGLLDQEEHKQ